MRERKGKDWIPLWIDKWLFGSTVFELSLAEQAVFIRLLCLAAKDEGYIRANPTTPYPMDSLAGLIRVPPKILEKAVERCVKTNKITRLPDGILHITNWSKYQLTPKWQRELTATEKPTSVKEEVTSVKTEVASQKEEVTSVKTEVASQKREDDIKEDEIKEDDIKTDEIKRKEDEEKELRANALSFFDYYKLKAGKKKMRFETWKPNIYARLGKYTLEELKTCVDNLTSSQWHIENAQLNIDLIVSSDKRVEKLLERKPTQQEIEEKQVEQRQAEIDKQKEDELEQLKEEEKKFREQITPEEIEQRKKDLQEIIQKAKQKMSVNNALSTAIPSTEAGK